MKHLLFKSCLLVVVMTALLFAFGSVTAFADTVSGTCEDNLTWTFDSDTGTLTVSGTGKMNYFPPSFPPWGQYTEKIKNVVIGDGVTNISSYAFNGCTNLISITMPDSVTSIGSDAFHNCTRLTSITIPDSVTSIGSNAFYGCTSLISVTIPDSVTSIGDLQLHWFNFAYNSKRR